MQAADFLTHFSKLEDPRISNHNTRHKFLDILVNKSIDEAMCYYNDSLNNSTNVR